MSGDPVDRYDVEHMIRDACVALRSDISNLAAELRAAIDELREAIGEERVDRQDADESLQRVIDSRTERFVTAARAALVTAARAALAESEETT